MKKKLLALAVLGSLAAPVFAQSNVQIYGVADAYMRYGQLMGDDLMSVHDGGIAGSRLGFRGEEDLGNGLKAVFLLEEGYDISTGKSAYMSGTDSAANSGSDVFTRQAYVGLKGSFGQVSLGRQYAPGYFADPYDAFMGGTVGPMADLTTFGGLTIQPASLARWNNSVAYNGTFQSVSIAAIYSAGNKETEMAGSSGYDASDDDKYGVSLKYDNGPLKLGAIYQGVKFKSRFSGGSYIDSPADRDETQQDWLIGAAYNFGVATVMGLYQKGSDVFGRSDLDVDFWQLGAVVPVGPGNIRLAYGQEKIDTPSGPDYKPKSFTLGYTQDLSKRTAVYVGYHYTDYDDMPWGTALGYGFVAGANGHSTTTPENMDSTSFAYVGMIHRF
ncbi:porin [Tepidiphilus thermophilus]|uniref:Outer membrane protein (Porin) n=1 Tax=Tepidiphilus thermophilus TaxID=876478 RepID=A0A0K6IWC2_9PROT|nr:porin [Tepidiphilus thermophilus]CUB07607.1 Outer membrane protein (porin) [Tepidiphilus thermophilus]